MSLVTTQRIENLKSYIQANRDNCKRCGLSIFWAKTAKGKNIPIDFPNYQLRGNVKLTHELVLGSKDGKWDGSCEAWPSQKPTHTCHFDTCEKTGSHEHTNVGSAEANGGRVTRHNHGGPHEHAHKGGPLAPLFSEADYR